MLALIAAFIVCFYLSAIIGKLFRMTPHSSNTLAFYLFGSLFASWLIYCLF